MRVKADRQDRFGPTRGITITVKRCRIACPLKLSLSALAQRLVFNQPKSTCRRTSSPANRPPAKAAVSFFIRCASAGGFSA